MYQQIINTFTKSIGSPLLKDGVRVNLITRAITTGANRGINRKQHKQSKRFIDKVKIRVVGGDGGKGCISFQKLTSGAASKGGGRSKPKRKADGGHGGRGGSVVLIADREVNGGNAFGQSIVGRKKNFVADSGGSGGSNRRNGKNGKNLLIRVPCGVLVKEVKLDTIEEDAVYDDDEEGMMMEDDGGFYHDTMESDDEPDNNYMASSTNTTTTTTVLADLDEHMSYEVLAIGGRGGIGNSLFGRKQHRYFQEENEKLEYERKMYNHSIGSKGQNRLIELELKMIADIGLVGFPNAGKSTLLNALSKVRPEIASYPFTTLHPLVGNVEYRDGVNVKVADVPGLIRDASLGRGRGFEFLRHLERTKALIFIVDGSLSECKENRNYINDLKVLANELKTYDELKLTEVEYGNYMPLMSRPALVIVNKLDLIQNPEEKIGILAHVAEASKEAGINNIYNHTNQHGDDYQGICGVLGISAGVSGEGLTELTRRIRKTVVGSEVTFNTQVKYQ